MIMIDRPMTKTQALSAIIFHLCWNAWLSVTFGSDWTPGVRHHIFSKRSFQTVTHPHNERLQTSL